MRKRRTRDIIAGRVSSGGSAVAGTDFMVEVVATGTYRVRITDPDFRLLGVVATSMNDGHLVQANVENEKSFLCTNRISNSHAVTSASFSFVAVGL